MNFPRGTWKAMGNLIQDNLFLGQDLDLGTSPSNEQDFQSFVSKFSDTILPFLDGGTDVFQMTVRPYFWLKCGCNGAAWSRMIVFTKSLNTGSAKKCIHTLTKENYVV